MKQKLRSLRILFLSALIFYATGCGDEKHCKQYSDVPVNITIFPNSTEYQQLNTVNGWLYLTARKPSKGIIIYRSSLNHFQAYERTCPHDPNDPTAILQVDEETELFAYDSVCGSRFILTSGYPLDGPAQCPMIQYRTSYDGNSLRIYN